MIDYRVACEKMIQEQLKAGGIKDEVVLQAFREVPRHLFVSEALQDSAYGNHPLPIGFSQTISQPFIVALMTEKLGITKEHKVLEIGTGSGYQTAILSKLAYQVYSIERFKELTTKAQDLFDFLGLNNILMAVADGTRGWKEVSPFDRIIVTAAAPAIPQRLLDQLAPEGRLIIPVGAIELQELMLVVRKGDEFQEEKITGCRFVPLIGKDGWKE